MIIPEAFRQFRQFILWVARPSKRPGKIDKIPIDPNTGREIDAHDPSNHLSSEEALAALAALAAGRGSGIGFVFTARDPFFFLDIDDCLQPDGQWSQLSQQLCSSMAGCFMEVSYSGKGLHVFGVCDQIDHSCRADAHGLEFYTSGRFAALTGIGPQGNAWTAVHPDALQWLISTYFPPRQAVSLAEWTEGPDPSWSGPEDDDELIRRMLSAKGSAASAFSGRASVTALWNADADELSVAFPDNVRGWDWSRADAALLQHLAFWTGRDCARIDRLFRRSALYRDKWERQDYSYGSILHAVSHCTKVYQQRQQPAEQDHGSYNFLTVRQQLEHFDKCVYVRELHRAFVPDGFLLKPEQFKVEYGGHIFALDAIADKVTKNAWEAFTENRAHRFPRAHTACFRPENEPAELIEDGGLILVNTYIPIKTLQKDGDPSFFLDLMHRLFPDPRDREIMLSYMAACKQYPGAKFQWWPVIQGVKGNGKSAIIDIMEFAIGLRYSFRPNSEVMAKTGNQFNTWAYRRLFIGIDEIYVADRRAFLEAFKTMVTNRWIPFEGKGADQVMGDNRANGIIATNHRDGVPITDDERRYAPFFLPQQAPGDLIRDGMGGKYFPSLYNWLRDDGFAIVNGFLQSYRICEEFNPATECHRAPETSSTKEAIRSGLGSIEQDILEAIEQDRAGFAGGWVSSLALDKIIDERRVRMSHMKKRELMQSMGYILHPALRDGRVNNPITDSGVVGKPRLWIRSGHLAANLQTAAEVVRKYQEAQNANNPLASGKAVAGTI